jgi:hypothetical protein
MSEFFITVANAKSGEIIVGETVKAFQLQVVKPNSDVIKRIGRITNGSFTDKYWIKNDMYGGIAELLVSKFSELAHINVHEILFLEDVIWEEKPTGKRPWIAKTSKANQWLVNTWGYRYVTQIRRYFTEKMSTEQLVALIYHELRHIGPYDDIVPHDIEDWSNMIATMGVDWDRTSTEIVDILDDEFPGWQDFRLPRQQKLFNGKVISLNQEQPMENAE